MEQVIERFDNKIVLRLNTEGFDALSIQQKNLVRHLTLAGHAGRDITYLQNCKHGLIARQTLEAMYQQLIASPRAEFDGFIEYLKVFYASNGLYDNHHNGRLPVTFTEAQFNALAKETSAPADAIEITRKALFDPSFIKPYRTFKEGEGDLLALSEVNVYENLTAEEATGFRAAHYSKDKRAPNRGVNTRLVKSINPVDGTSIIEEQIMKIDGLYGEHIAKIVEHLKLATQYAENTIQKESIEHLIRFYETGDPAYFDEHCKSWIADTNSDIVFINGFIEDYQDPLGTACFFESLVAFKNPIESKRIHSIIENIQWFEDHLPCDTRFKKTKASAMSASSVTMIGFSGQMNPQPPRGVILPNAEWLREEVGSKTLTLSNVIHAQESTSHWIVDEFIHPNYRDVVREYGSDTTIELINLHEMCGHALGQLLDNVRNSDMKEFRSVIEESRADIIALYYIADPKLIEIGLLPPDTDIEKFAYAAYVNYFTSGSFLQLRRLPDFTTSLSQPHMRNRQLICDYILDMAKTCRSIEWVKRDAKRYIVINDLQGLRKLIAVALAEIQRIKSEGDYEAAKKLAFKYGTYVDQDTLVEVKQRIAKINPPAWTAFVSPSFVEIPTESTESGMKNWTLSQPESFLEDQMELSKF